MAGPDPDQGVVADLNQVAYLFLDLAKFPSAPPIWGRVPQILSAQIQTEARIWCRADRGPDHVPARP